jgi:ABC-type branched-subunit amino acid transport system substrate-binding protein
MSVFGESGMYRRAPQSVVTVSLVLVLLLAASCSSTSRNSTEQPPAAGEIAERTADASGGEHADASAPARGSGPAAKSAGASSSTTDTGPAPDTVRSAPGGFRLGRGVTNDSILFGSVISRNTDTLAKSAGVSGTATDERRVVDAIVKYINAHGGIAGRKVRVAIHEVDIASAQPFAAQAQATCADLAQDKHVFAVDGSPVQTGQDLPVCLAKLQTPLIDHSGNPYDDTDFGHFAPSFYRTGFPTADAYVGSVIATLAAAGYFDRGARIGLLKQSGDTYDRIEGLVKKELAARGLRLAKTYTVRSPSNIQDLGSVSTQINNAILQFRSANITHVLFDQAGGTLPFFFLPQAESQGYRPRYGFSSIDVPFSWASSAPAAQMERALLAGWRPLSDAIAESALDATSSAKLCTKIMKDAGIDPYTKYYSHTHCDSYLFFKAALDGTRDLTQTGLRAAIDKLGSRFTSTQTPATRFTRGRYGGPTWIRAASWNADCECFRYTGTARTIP